MRRIDGDELKKKISDRLKWAKENYDRRDLICRGYIAGLEEAEEEIDSVPTAEKRGRWVDVEPAPHNLFYATCSVCGDRQTIEMANYCPMCGASMQGEEE